MMMMMVGMGEPWTRGTPIAWITPFSSRLAQETQGNIAKTFSSFPIMGSTNQSCSGAVPGQANQLAVKILELGDVVGKVDELQGGEWLHGASEHNQTKVR